MIHLLSHVAGSEVNDSRPVGSGHLALKSPSDCARDSDWMIPLILMHIPIFDIFLFFCILSFFFTFSIVFVFSLLFGARWQSSFDWVSHHLDGSNLPRFVEL